MDFKTIKEIVIKEGSVKSISNGKILWSKNVAENKWNLLNRSEFRGTRDGTYYFNSTNTNHRMELSENYWVNGGRHVTNGVYFSSTANAANFCTLSNITENSFTITSGTGATDLFVAFPFHLNAGETITIIHTRSGHNRSGYQIFNTDGTLSSYVRNNLANTPGAINTDAYTAENECWYFWLCGRYDAGTSVTISNINVTIV